MRETKSSGRVFVNQEFYVSVTPVREDEFLVRTERVSPGVPLAEELVTWQVDEWLEQARQLMHDPLLGILRGRMRSLNQAASNGEAMSPNLVELGQTLYNALFQGTIRDSWMTAQGIAQNRRESLRLRLGLKGDRLPRLPWEVLHAGARPLATGTDVVFSRYQASFAPMATILQPHARSLPLDPNQPLRILMVLAAPTDQEVLELQREATHLREELLQEQGQSGGEIELTILNQPGREQLTQALEQGHYQVLHYAGHSNLGMSGGDLYLVSDRTGLTEVLSGDDLAGLLVNNGIRMVVFNSCRGVYTATADPTDESESSNLTDALLKRGIPAVLAMAERIPDDVALTLSRLFYRNLKQRYPIDLNLSRARQGLLSAYGSNQLYWALPILYLHPDFDGYLQPSLPQVAMRSPSEVSSNFTTAFDSEAATTNHPSDLAEAETLFDDLEFDDPDDSDRQAVLDLLQELSGTPQQSPPENPFSANDRSNEEFFEHQSNGYAFPSLSEIDEAQLTTVADCLILGQARYEQGDLAGAISAYGRALQLDPNSADAYHQMGVVLEEFDSPAEAIIAYKMAVQLNPDLQQTQARLQRMELAHNLNRSTTAGEAPTGVAVETPAAIATAPSSPSSRIFAPSKPATPNRRPWLAAGIFSTAIAAVVAIWGISSGKFNREPSPSDVLPTVEQVNPNPSNVPTSRVAALTATATTSFIQGNLRAGQEAVETLLDNNAVWEAQQAFQNVPADKRSTPAMSFLQGRLAWQSIQNGNRNFSLDDVARYWQTAQRSGKQDAQVYNALGFVYYAQGDLPRASKAWQRASELAIAQQKNSPNTATGKANPAKQDELTAYAGLALASQKSVKNQPAGQRTRLQQKAVELRDAVLRQSPNEFQVNSLAQNWLWNQTAIADWRALLAVK
jgi:tetratricopeptide (TPR) repeat protein